MHTSAHKYPYSPAPGSVLWTAPQRIASRWGFLEEGYTCKVQCRHELELNVISSSVQFNWTWSRRRFSSWFMVQVQVQGQMNRASIHTKPCKNQCRWHSHASTDSGLSLFRVSVIILPLLLKHLSHSEDIAGIDRASNAIRVRLGQRGSTVLQ